MINYILCESGTEFIHRLALGTKHWLSQSVTYFLSLKISIVLFSRLEKAIFNIWYPMYLQIVSNVRLIYSNVKDKFHYFLHILLAIRQIHGVS